MTASITSHGNPRALLLSSDPAARAQLEDALAARGLDVRSSAEGESGLALLLDELLTLDVLVLDLRLDECDAWSFLRLIRRAGGERELPIVVAARGVGSTTAASLVAEGADAAYDLDRSAEEAADTVARLAMGGYARQLPLIGNRPQEMRPSLAA